jgi:hypothetical protein
VKNASDVPRDVMERAIDEHVAPFFKQHGIRVDQPRKEYYRENVAKFAIGKSKL